MEEKKSLNSQYFKDVYDANDDPWDFETSEYELNKYSATIKSLPKSKYRNVLEIGCSIGVLTQLLAEICDALLATDISQKAMNKAIKRLEKSENVVFKQATFPQELPNDRFDLVVISEVAYYLSVEDWNTAMQKLLEIVEKGGNILLCHWLPEVHDYPQTGDQVHNSFEKFMDGKMKNVYAKREENYRIDVWEKLEGK